MLLTAEKVWVSKVAGNRAKREDLNTYCTYCTDVMDLLPVSSEQC